MIDRWLDRLVTVLRATAIETVGKRAKESMRANRRRLVRQRLQGMELLEDRRVFAGFSLVGSTLQIDLATNEAIGISSSGSNYAFALASGMWTGINAAGATGNGLSTLSATAALVTAIKVDDAGAGNSVAFADSGTHSFSSNFTIALDNAAAGAIAFTGTTSFTLSAELNASTSKKILVNPGSILSSANGNITMSANQQVVATIGSFIGIDVNGATVKTTGNGMISLTGKGGTVGNGNFGIQVRAGSLLETTGSGSIALTGAMGTLTDTTGFALQVTGLGSTIRTSVGTGSITLKADTVDIAAFGTINAGVNNATLVPRSNGVAINLGAADNLSATMLGLTDDELDLITAGTLKIGDGSSGAITVKAAISPAAYKTLALGNSVTFDAASSFIAEVGPTATIYEKITVSGTITINAGAALSVAPTGGYIASTGDIFTFIANDLSEAISGTFAGPTLTNFLGSSLTATQSYVGGSGNDLVIAVLNLAPTFTPGSNVIVNEDSGAQTIANWATGISPGQGETAQLLAFSVNRITPPVTATQTQWGGFGGGPQHQAISSVASQPLNAIRWQTPVDLSPQYSGTSLLIHYGSPVVTQANTVIVPVKTGATDGFRIDARNGADGTLIWSQLTDYTFPTHNWTPSYGPTLAIGNRIYFPGAGGTVYWRDNVDSPTANTSGQIAFYGLSNYNADRTAYNSGISISTPLTADAAGNIYFGYRTIGANPLGITDGFARIAPNGSSLFTSASTASAGAFGHAVTNAAPAVSLDGAHIYVVVSSGLGFSQGNLLRLNSTTLALESSVTLKDAKTGNNAFLPDDGSASPMVGPDGDVYFGVFDNPSGSNHYRGWMLHFSSDLTQSKTPGAFGWDNTASVVPSVMVPSYHGTSTYLLMTKYNNYVSGGGDGVNKIAILDPNATMIDPITGATVMLEVLTIAGATQDSEYPNYPLAVREWCINTAVVDPATKSILANSEDGKLYRWDLTTNTFSQVVTLTPGIGEAYTPTLIGADGAVYAINNGTLFSVGYDINDLNSGLFSVLPTVDPLTGTLTFTPAANAFGTSQITLSLKDNGGTANGGVDTTTHTFSIQVQGVNDAPVLTRVFQSVSGDILTALANNGTWSDVDSVAVNLSASLGTVVKNGDGTWNWSYVPTEAQNNHVITITANDGTILTSVSFTITTDSKVYYKGSAFAGTSVNAALDTSKALMLSGAIPQTLSYSNIINTTRGINGIVLDVAGLTAAALTDADFGFRVSPQGVFDEATNPPNTWANAPIPTAIVVTPGSPTMPSRVRLEWADNAIANRWLQIRIFANANTGLANTKVYYLGHLLGEMNGDSFGGAYFVNNADLTRVLPLGGGIASVSNIRDVDKNRFVLNSDGIAIRSSLIAGNSLRNITIPIAGSSAEGANNGNRRDNTSSGGFAPPPASDQCALSSVRHALDNSNELTNASNYWTNEQMIKHPHPEVFNRTPALDETHVAHKLSFVRSSARPRIPSNPIASQLADDFFAKLSP